MRGFENFSAMASTSEGFEWRWTFISDFIDDYHDGNLGLTIDGGYFDEDVQQKYDEAAYLADRKNISYIKPFNRFFIERDGKLHPVEIKLTSNPNKSMIKHFNVLSEQGYGGLICMRETDMPLMEDVSAIPVSYL